MWGWRNSTGNLSRDGVIISSGYSGAGRGKNNPVMEAATGVGPIPKGDWNIAGVHNSPNTGPYTITLEAQPGTDTFGRSAFRIHGDSLKAPGTASHGCIILPRSVREKIIASNDKLLRVLD